MNMMMNDDSAFPNINLAIEHFSIVHNKLEKPCFKDLDVRCLPFVLSFTLNL